MRRGLKLKALEVGAYLGGGPVLRADELAPDNALAVDNVGLGPLLSMIEFGRALGGVADGDQVDVAAEEEAAVGVGIFVDADGKDGQIGLLAVEFEEGGQFHDARLAPGGPEVEQHNLASIVGQMNGRGSVGDSEVRGYLTGLGGMCAAVACGHQGQRKEQREWNESRKPHILIIRSERANRHGERQA